MNPGTDELIAITGADGQVGRALLAQLRGGPARTVALTRRASELPADRREAGPLDSPAAQAALREADVIVHLAGTMRPLDGNSYEAANVETTRAVTRAVMTGRARRILYLSYVGAGEDSVNEYVSSKARAERLLTQTGREVVIFRCTHIIGPPEAPGPMAQALQAKPRKPVMVLGDGAQLVRPIYLGDVVAMLRSALHVGSPGVYELAGPECMTMDELVGLINRPRAVRITHLPRWAARLLPRVVPSLPRAMVDVLLWDSIGESSRATSAFGPSPTSLTGLWASGAAGEDPSRFPEK